MPVSKRVRTLFSVVLAAAAIGAAGPGSASASTAPTCADACFLDARTGAHTTFDRLVFDLTGPTLPTWTATVSTDGSYIGPSGDTKHYTIPGSSYLTLDFSSASTTATDGTSLYTTSNPLTVALPSLKGVQLTADFEGHVDFGLSLGSYSGYSVFTLTSPNRVVIDLQH